VDLGIAVGGLVIAVASAIIAIRALQASSKSAEAAKRSAGAAEESVEIQRQEAEAARQARQLNQMADVMPLYWEGRNGQTHRGLVVKNNGPAVARQLVAYELTRNGTPRKWQHPALSSGETIGLIGNEEAVPTDEINRIGLPDIEANAYGAARIEWVNSDGTASVTDWRPIQQRH
jgi:hypothetical protein